MVAGYRYHKQRGQQLQNNLTEALVVPLAQALVHKRQHSCHAAARSPHPVPGADWTPTAVRRSFHCVLDGLVAAAEIFNAVSTVACTHMLLSELNGHR